MKKEIKAEKQTQELIAAKVKSLTPAKGGKMMTEGATVEKPT